MLRLMTLVVLAGFISAEGHQHEHAQMGLDFFTGLDSNRDGNITLDETRNYFQGFDVNKNGEIDKAEFTSSISKRDPSFLGHEDLIFHMFDKNKDSKINSLDIVTVYRLADTNGNGAIDKQEYDNVLKRVVTAFTG